MQFKRTVLYSILVTAFLFYLTVEALQPNPRINNNNNNQSKDPKLNQVQDESSEKIKLAADEQPESNLVDDDQDRIKLGEPFKSLVQTSARFALVQMKISSHVNIETAMDLINNLGYALSKPANLIKAIKAVTAFIATILATNFLFPSAYVYADRVWRDPVRALNLEKYLVNGISEKSVMKILTSKTDDALSRYGLHDVSCRERSLCYMGEMAKCTFPETSETITKFASDNFSNSSYKENKYLKAFLDGFVDQNCTKIPETAESNNCLGNFVNSIITSRWPGEMMNARATGNKTKYQTIQASRA